MTIAFNATVKQRGRSDLPFVRFYSENEVSSIGASALAKALEAREGPDGQLQTGSLHSLSLERMSILVCWPESFERFIAAALPQAGHNKSCRRQRKTFLNH